MSDEQKEQDQSEWSKLDEHLHGKPVETAERSPEATEWDKLDEHLSGKKREENTWEWTVARKEDHITLVTLERVMAKIDFAEVYLNGVLLYDSRNFNTGDVIKVVVHNEEMDEDGTAVAL